METSRRDAGDIVILDLTGHLDLFNFPLFEKHVSDLLNEKKVQVILNFSGAPYVDSSAIRALISLLSVMQQHGGELKICSLSDPVRRVFKLTSLESYFHIYDSEEDAIRAYGG